MAIDLAMLKRGLDSNEIKYFDVDAQTLGLAIKTSSVNLKLTLALSENGEYLRLRSVALLTCTAEHPAFDDVAACLTKANARYKLVKLSWDKKDGEVVAEAALPIEGDGRLAPDQVMGMLAALSGVTEQIYPDLERLVGAARPQPSQPASRPAIAAAHRTESVESPPKESASAPQHPAPSRGSSTASIVLAVGVLFLGVAALAAVVFVFIVNR